MFRAPGVAKLEKMELSGVRFSFFFNSVQGFRV